MLTIKKEDFEGVTNITLEGVIDEKSRLQELFQDTQDSIFIYMKGIRRINSSGVQEWVSALEKIPETKKLYFVECSTSVIKQFNLISNFAGPGEVVSFLAPYICEECGLEEEKLLVIEEYSDILGKMKAPPFPCPRCGIQMRFDDIEERYFCFIQRGKKKVFPGESP